MRKKVAQKRKRVRKSIIPRKGAKPSLARKGGGGRVQRVNPSEQLAAYQLNKLKATDAAPKPSLAEQLMSKIKKPMLNSSIIERAAKDVTSKYMPLTEKFNDPEDVRDTREARNEAIRNSIYDRLQNDRAKYEYDLQMADATGKAAEGLPVSHLHNDAIERYITNLNESEDRAKINAEDFKRHRDTLALRHHGRQDVPIEEAERTPVESPKSMTGIQPTSPSPITPQPQSPQPMSTASSPQAPQPISVNINIQGGNGAPVTVSQSPTPAAPTRVAPPRVTQAPPVQTPVASPRQHQPSPPPADEDESMATASSGSSMDSLIDMFQRA